MNPWEALGIPEDASEEQIRAAYLGKVKEFPPERAPEEFEKVRDAYDSLRDPRRRGRLVLLGPDPTTPLVSLLDGLPGERKFVGPKPWLKVLNGR
ncbi:MAG: J domain-containing protein [Bryobacteraceae bacterium]